MSHKAAVAGTDATRDGSLKVVYEEHCNGKPVVVVVDVVVTVVEELVVDTEVVLDELVVVTVVTATYKILD